MLESGVEHADGNLPGASSILCLAHVWHKADPANTWRYGIPRRSGIRYKAGRISAAPVDASLYKMVEVVESLPRYSLQWVQLWHSVPDVLH